MKKYKIIEWSIEYAENKIQALGINGQIDATLIATVEDGS
jgi:hypothetical protein